MSVNLAKLRTRKEPNAFRLMPFLIIMLLILAFVGFQLYYLVRTIIEY